MGLHARNTLFTKTGSSQHAGLPDGSRTGDSGPISSDEGFALAAWTWYPGPTPLVVTQMGASQAEEGHSLPLETLIPWKELDPVEFTNPHWASLWSRQVLPPLLPPQLSFKARIYPADVKPFAEAWSGVFSRAQLSWDCSGGLQSSCFLQTGVDSRWLRGGTDDRGGQIDKGLLKLVFVFS